MGFRIAVTGGIGSGKSMVCKALCAFGYPVYDSDTEARRLMHSDEAVIAAMVAEFGAEAYTDGRLNRPFIASQVFGSPERLLKLNSIVHPAVVADFVRWAAERNERLVFVETALLFESRLCSAVDKSIAVVAPEGLRVMRVMSRDGITEQEAYGRIRSQMEQDKLASMCDYTVVSDQVRLVLPQLERIVGELENDI